MKGIDFKLINEPLEEHYYSTINRLEREFNEDEASLFKVLLLARRNHEIKEANNVVHIV
jgi:hypothetical protein